METLITFDTIHTHETTLALAQGVTPNATLERKPLARDDDFPGVILQLADRHRLIVGSAIGSDATCWTIQYRHGPDRWEGRKFLTRARSVPHAVRQLDLGKDAFEAAKAWAARPGSASV